MLNAHQVASLALDIPQLHVRKNFQGRTVTVLGAPRTRSNSTQTSRCAAKKTDQAISLAQGKGLQNDGFRFPGGHTLVGAPTAIRRLRTLLQKNANANQISYHTLPCCATFSAVFMEIFSDLRFSVHPFPVSVHRRRTGVRLRNSSNQARRAVCKSPHGRRCPHKTLRLMDLRL